MQGKKVSESEVVMLHHVRLKEANNSGVIHGGDLFTHIDNAAGIAAMRHARCRTVTASVNHMDFLAPIRPGENIVVKASLHLVGRSSMEIGIRVEAENLLTGELRHAARCYVTYVALDEAGRPKEVPPLILENDTERRRAAEALERKRLKKITPMS